MSNDLHTNIDVFDEMETAQANTIFNQRQRTFDDVFIPNKHNKPPILKPVISINGVGILTHQNITCIIANPGSGKTSVCEAICSAVINPNIDSLGIEVSSEITKILFFDTERVNVDVWNSYDRMNRRAGTQDSDRAYIVAMRMIPYAKTRRERIEALIEEHQPQLIILDGAADMLDDTNSLPEAEDLTTWIRQLTSKYNLSILTTLHPNKGTTNPRGHIGGELKRQAEGMLFIETNGETKTVTNDFAHGKNRNGGKANTSFVWSDDKRMFVSCEAPTNSLKKLEPHKVISNEEIRKLVAECVENEPNATDFKHVLKLKLTEQYSRAKVGATSINDFYTWLQVHKFITLTGTAAKKKVIQVVEPPEMVQQKIDLENE
jgi:hypothetical protein